MKFFMGENKNEKVPQPKIEKLLPESIRYALRYGEGKIHKEDVETLNHSHFIPEASYMTAKLLTTFDEKAYQQYLSELISLFVQKEIDQTILQKQNQNLNDTTLKNIPKTIEVSAMKLAQISRQGFDLWQEKYKELAHELVSTDQELFLTLNSTIIGLKHFTEEYGKNNKPISFIVPEFIEGGKDIIGFMCEFKTDGVVLKEISKDFIRPDNAIIIDDVKNTGETEKIIRTFWNKETEDVPEFKTIVQ